MGSNDLSTHQDMLLGVTISLLGAAGQFISPLIPENKSAQFITISENTPDGQLKKLTFAEELLKDCANKEKAARSWKNHVITGTANLSAGLITWLGFKRSIGQGIECFGINMAITEIQIWTAPTFAKRKFESYYQDNIQLGKNISYLPKVNYYLAAQPSGLCIRLFF